MGWFWADSDVSIVNTSVPRTASNGMPHAMPSGNLSPPPGCPMHESGSTPIAKASSPPPESACPYTPTNISKKDNPHTSSSDSSITPQAQTPSKYSKYNPLNYMFSDLSQDRAENQTVSLPTEREPSTIPKGDGEGNWEYPSPQQMYNALLRKGFTDTDATAVESMVSVHNFLNEGAWAEIVEWERRFGKGLGRGWEMCKRGEKGSLAGAGLDVGANEDEVVQPKLLRFMGRPKDMTPKAAMTQVLGRIWPSAFGTEPPFDRHDWFVSREHNGAKKEIRYVIDYYSGPDEPTGEPVFYLDVRPALTPTAAVERMMRWGGDVWYRASGAELREKHVN